MNRTKRDLRELLAAGRFGNMAAYNEFMRQTARLFRAYFLKRCKNGFDADDLTQNALVKVHLYNKSCDGTRAVEPWLYKIAKNIYIDHLNRKTIHTELIESDLEHKDAFHLAFSLSGAVDKLPSTMKRTFKLVKIDGHSIREAADILGITESAAKVRLHRTCKALKQAI